MTRQYDHDTDSRGSRLRIRLAPLHEELESTANARALVEGTIDLPGYLSLHQRLWHIHRTLDHAFVAEPRLRPFLNEEDLRAETLQRDLAVLGKQLPRTPDSLTRNVLNDIDAADGPWTRRLGMLYVAKGSRLGAKLLADPVSKVLNVPLEPEEGLDYYLNGWEKLPGQWRRFLSHLDEAPMSIPEEKALLQGAECLMKALLVLYRSRPAEIVTMDSPGATPQQK